MSNNCLPEKQEGQKTDLQLIIELKQEIEQIKRTFGIKSQDKGPEEMFAEALEESPYWTLRGCNENGYVKVPKTLWNFIMNISGECTDYCNGPTYYRNPEVMFQALDIIYWITASDLKKLELKLQEMADE